MLSLMALTMGLLQYKEMQLWGKARLLTMWTSQGSTWTLGSLGNLDSMDLLGEPLDSWHLGPLAIMTSWQFGSLGNLDLGPSWPLWHLVISLMILASRKSFWIFSRKALELLMLWNSWELFGSISSWTEFRLLAINFIFAQLGDKTI